MRTSNKLYIANRSYTKDGTLTQCLIYDNTGERATLRVTGFSFHDSSYRPVTHGELQQLQELWNKEFTNG
jgi:hypothetical protein